MFEDYLCALDPNLLPASFAGVSFWVDKTSEDYARRIQTHEFPNSDQPWHEDLGERYREFTVTAYVAGFDAVEQKEALKQACITQGAFNLQMPAMPAINAVCMSFSATPSRDKQGVIDCVMKFREDFGSQATSIAPAPVFEQLIMSIGLDAIDAFMSVFDTLFTGFGTLPYVTSNLVGIIESFSDQVLTFVGTYPTTGSSERVARVNRLALAMYQNASNYVQPIGYSVFQNGNVAQPVNVFGQLTSLTAYQPSNFTALSGQLQPVDPSLQNPYAAQFVADCATLLDALSGVLTPADAYTAMQTFAAYDVGIVPAVPASQTFGASAAGVVAPSDQINFDSATALNDIIQAFGLIQMCRAACAQDYATQADAVQARADIVELSASQVNAILDADAAAKLIQARDYAVTYLSGKASRSQIDTVEASSSMPSLYWAYRIYGDVERADELIAYNNVPMPCFMPVVFDAIMDN